jgi:hypothetical protein
MSGLKVLKAQINKTDRQTLRAAWRRAKRVEL